MTDPSQYFKGRTVQEQMNEVIGYVDVRSAEVATDAIAADVAQVHSDAADAHADALAAAASAAAAAGTLANAVKKTGEVSQSIAGDIAVAGDLTGGTVTVPTPVNNTDAASKKYVDDQDALDVHLAGNQTVNDVKTFSSSPVVPTEATGTFSTKAANSTKLKNEMDNYGMVMRTAGVQTFTGVKKGSGSGVYHKLSSLSTVAEPPSGSTTEEIFSLESSNGGTIVQLFNSETKDAQCILNLSTKHIFKDDDDSIKNTQATLWLVAYKDKAVLFLRGTDKNGTSTAQAIATLNF